jgi:S1-C subfamily serine protease
LAVVLSLVGLLSGGCVLARRTTPDRLTENGFRRLFEATVAIRVAQPGGRSRTGSGFVATRDGWVVTSSHVVGEGQVVPILDYASQESSSTDMVFTWRARDLAVIIPRHPPAVEPLRFGDSDRIEPGQALFTCGLPFGLGRVVTRGVVDGRVAFESPRYVVWDGILANGISHPGDSGGPVVTADGRVVGVHLGSVSSERRAVIPGALVKRTLVEARVRAEHRARSRNLYSASARW